MTNYIQIKIFFIFGKFWERAIKFVFSFSAHLNQIWQQECHYLEQDMPLYIFTITLLLKFDCDFRQSLGTDKFERLENWIKCSFNSAGLMINCCETETV